MNELSATPTNSDESIFICNICLDIANNPVITQCGHLFCWACLYRWMNTKSTSVQNNNNNATTPCPVCKCLVTKSNLIPLYVNAINSTNKQSIQSKCTKSESSAALSPANTASNEAVTSSLSSVPSSGSGIAGYQASDGLEASEPRAEDGGQSHTNNNTPLDVPSSTGGVGETIPNRPLVSHNEINNSILLEELTRTMNSIRTHDDADDEHRAMGFFPSLFTLQLSMFTNYIWNGSRSGTVNTSRTNNPNRNASVFEYVTELFDFASSDSNPDPSTFHGAGNDNPSNAYDELVINRLNHQQRELSRFLIGLGFFVLFCLLFI